ncbi:MAG: hypothetical protein WC216_04475 [Gallionella sp.]|jgi:hypothetical protein
MSAAQNLAYSLVQVVHNFGAVAAVGGSLAALKFRGVDTRRILAKVALGGLATQGLSGAAFGATSYFFYHRFPDIAGIAIAALAIKILCVVIGCLLLASYLMPGKDWAVTRMNVIWIALALLTSTALTAAAFLRWFS